MKRSAMIDVNVAIIGAGPHGLAAAVRLRRQGVDVRVFGRPMSFWQTMPAGMLLRSNMSATNMVEPQGPLSLRAYMSETSSRFDYPIPLADFIAYGTWVQKTAVPNVDERLVSRLRSTGSRFELTLEGGEALVARRVIIASGIRPFAKVPAGFDGLPHTRVSHTSDHSDLSIFAGRRVAVVGGGQSALEYAALMSESGAEVEVFIRAPRVVWLHGWSLKRRLGPIGKVVYAPTDVGPIWYSRLVATPVAFRRLPRDVQARVAYRSVRPACSHFVRVRLDPVSLTLGTRVLSVLPTDGGLQIALSDGTERNVDHLMFATGYRVDLASYPFVDPGIAGALREVGGYPVLGRGLETSVPGLHVMGAPAALSFGPIMRFVSGSWYGSNAVAKVIRESTRRPVARTFGRRESPNRSTEGTPHISGPPTVAPEAQTGQRQ